MNEVIDLSQIDVTKIKIGSKEYLDLPIDVKTDINNYHIHGIEPIKAGLQKFFKWKEL